MIFDELEAALARLEGQYLRRSQRGIDSPCGPRVMVDGQERLAFCSNDYLGLANHPKLVAALCAANV